MSGHRQGGVGHGLVASAMIQVSAKYSLALSSREFTYDTLLHRKALLVITASNADNLSQSISMDILFS